jgi:hypothetical protein
MTNHPRFHGANTLRAQYVREQFDRFINRDFVGRLPGAAQYAAWRQEALTRYPAKKGKTRPKLPQCTDSAAHGISSKKEAYD